MVSAAQLQQFANQHGLIIPPHRDIKAWAADLTAIGDKCPCDPKRTCPCLESIDDINNALDPEEMCCKCRLFCNQDYVDHYERSWRKQGLYNKQPVVNPTELQPVVDLQELQPVVDSQELQRDIKNPEIKMLIDAFSEAKQLIEEGDPASAAAILKEEFDREEAKGNDACDICLGYLEAETYRAGMLSAECEIDDNACDPDTKAAINSLNRKITIYTAVDKHMEERPNPVEGLELDNIGPSKQLAKPVATQDNYHQCLSRTMKDDLIKTALGTQPDRFRAAVAHCKGGKSLEEAITETRNRQSA